jgi:GH15 family glucan-1,4-alpha-glucosidase
MASLPISDYALIGNLRTAALVSRTGSIDWLCWPRFDSGACFAALIGNTENGCWSIAPAAKDFQIERRYRPDTLILETEFATSTGRVRLIDFMPADAGRARLAICRGRADRRRLAWTSRRIRSIRHRGK